MIGWLEWNAIGCLNYTRSAGSGKLNARRRCFLKPRYGRLRNGCSFSASTTLSATSRSLETPRLNRDSRCHLSLQSSRDSHSFPEIDRTRFLHPTPSSWGMQVRQLDRCPGRKPLSIDRTFAGVRVRGREQASCPQSAGFGHYRKVSPWAKPL